jgi:hypothetical protein
MNRTYSIRVASGLILALTVLGSTVFLPPRDATGATLDICAQVTAAQLASLYRKPLVPTAQDNGCFWSLEPGTMAYLHIGVHDRFQDLRRYFNEKLSSHVLLAEISDIGDEGLMSISEGTLGVVVIRKGNRVLQSSVTFLDIEPNSTKQQVLWDVYRHIAEQM